MGKPRRETTQGQRSRPPKRATATRQSRGAERTAGGVAKRKRDGRSGRGKAAWAFKAERREGKQRSRQHDQNDALYAQAAVRARGPEGAATRPGPQERRTAA